MIIDYNSTKIHAELTHTTIAGKKRDGDTESKFARIWYQRSNKIHNCVGYAEHTSFFSRSLKTKGLVKGYLLSPIKQRKNKIIVNTS